MSEKESVPGDRTVDPAGPVFVIAEVRLGHERSVAQVSRLIDAAAESGVNAVRVRAHSTESLAVADSSRRDSIDPMLMERRRPSGLSLEDHCKLKQHADLRGISYLSTPCDEEAADSLDQIGVHGYRVASCDLTHLPLLRHIASKGKPVFLSTGMSYLNEVADAVWALRSGGAGEVILMHCVSSLPAPADSLNLRAIQTMREHFELPVGYSDHSLGTLFPLVAAALGAVVVEKTLVLEGTGGDADPITGIGPRELLSMVQSLRALEACLGDGRKHPASCEEENRARDRRSIVSACDIRAYESVAHWMLTCKRPGNGIEPAWVERLVGMQARRNIPRDTVLRWDDLVAAEGREPEGLGSLLRSDLEFANVSPAGIGKNGPGERGLPSAAANAQRGRQAD